MPKKPTGESQDTDQEPAAQHLHDEQKRPLKAPIGGVPANLPKQFPGKGPKNFGGKNAGNHRNFRHQGR